MSQVQRTAGVQPTLWPAPAGPDASTCAPPAVRYRLVEGLSIEPLVCWLGLDRPAIGRPPARLEGDFTAKRRAMDRLPDLLSSGLFSGAIAMRLQMQYDKQLGGIKATIEALHSTELGDDDTQRALLCLRALAEEKSLYVDTFDKGHLGERTFRQLLLALPAPV